MTKKDERRAAGLCPQCGGERDKPEFIQCTKCKKRTRRTPSYQRHQQRYQRKRRQRNQAQCILGLGIIYQSPE